MAGGVHDAVGEVAVVRQEQQPLGIAVESADRVHALRHIVEQVHHAAAVKFIRDRRHIAAGLVEHDVAQILLARNCNALTVHGDEILRQCLVAELDGSAVALDTALLDERLCLAARAVARIREDLLDSDSCHSFSLSLQPPGKSVPESFP